MEDAITLHVKSSSNNDGYTITLNRTKDSLLTMLCDCKAGQNGLVCKHRIAVVSGNQSILVDAQRDNDAWEECQHLLGQSALPGLVAELAAKELALDVLKRDLANSKKKIGNYLLSGF